MQPTPPPLEHVRRDVACRPLSRRGTLVVSGADRRSWLNGIVTADVSELQSNVAVFGLALSRAGKIQSDVYCLETGSRILVSTAPGTHEELFQQWDRMLIMEDAELGDESDAWSWGLLLGPDAAKHAPAVDGDGEWGRFEQLGLSGICLALKAGVLSSADIAVLDDAEWLELRLEAQIPEFGVDYKQTERPHEASLERRAVSWTKGCYLGQEVVCMQEMRGKVKRHLVVLRSTEPFTALPPSGSPLLDSEGKSVGQVTSAANSQRLGVGLLMARLDKSAEQESLFVESSGRRLSLELVRDTV